MVFIFGVINLLSGFIMYFEVWIGQTAKGRLENRPWIAHYMRTFKFLSVYNHFCISSICDLIFVEFVSTTEGTHLAFNHHTKKVKGQSILAWHTFL